MLLRVLMAGAVRPLVVCCREAQDLVAAGHIRGKVILKIGDSVQQQK